MTDTSPAIAELVRQKLMARPAEERFVMGALMFDAAREMVLASLPAGLPTVELKHRLFHRLYGRCHPCSKAFFNPSRTHRFWLRREWNKKKPTVVFVMLNPSDGDETENDMTIKRCISKAEYNDFGSLEIVNLYSRITRYPKELWKARRSGEAIVHPENNHWIKETCRGRTVVLACGSKAEMSRLNEVNRLLENVGAVPMCAAKSSGKVPMPKHPLAVCDNVIFQKF